MPCLSRPWAGAGNAEAAGLGKCLCGEWAGGVVVATSGECAGREWIGGCGVAVAACGEWICGGWTRTGWACTGAAATTAPGGRLPGRFGRRWELPEVWSGESWRGRFLSQSAVPDLSGLGKRRRAIANTCSAIGVGRAADRCAACTTRWRLGWAAWGWAARGWAAGKWACGWSSAKARCQRDDGDRRADRRPW